MKKFLKFAIVLIAAMAVLLGVKNDTQVSAKRYTKNNLYNVDVSTVSSWSNGTNYGRVMNIDFTNLSSSEYVIWEINLEFPCNISIDGNWGSDIHVSDRKITLSRNNLSSNLYSNATISMGLLLSSSNDFNDGDINVTIKPYQGPIYEIPDDPTQQPTVRPTQRPTVKPTQQPTVKPTQQPTVKPTQQPHENLLTAQQIVDEMKIGWNLGNTLDSLSHEWMTGRSPRDYETAWGNVVTTQALIDSVKQRGFNTVRIPVSWGEKLDGNNKIDEAWLNRVKEIVDYCYKNDMYVIVNTHHETSWLYPTENRKQEGATKLKAIWEQVADKFKDYDQHLIFETMNETRLVGTSDEWTAGTYESRNVINYFNEVAVKAIRNAGGKNANRAIMVPCYGANASGEAVNAMTFPANDNMLIISVHAYSPYYFSMVANQTDKWGSEQDKRDLTYQFDAIKNAAKGRPVVIGEMGTINKNNNDDQRAAHAAFYSKEAKKRGFTIIWWDNGQIGINEEEMYGIVNRTTLQWYYNNVIDALINNAKN